MEAAPLDLNKLTGDELTEAIELLESMRLDPTFLEFMPHDAQALYMMSTAQETLLFGGNQCGKTDAAVVHACMLATGEYPDWYPESAKIDTPNRGRFCGPDLKNWVSEILEPKFKRWLPESYIKDFKKSPQTKSLDQIVFKNGSVIDIMSYQQDQISFESWTGNWAKFDEPPKREQYIATIRGLAALNGRVSLTLTPLSEPWIFQLVDACKTSLNFGSKTYWEGNRTVGLGGRKKFKVSARIIHAVTDDNLIHPNWLGKMTGGMSEEGLATFDATLTEEERQVRRYGRFVHLQGLVYKEFDDAVHIIDDDAVPAIGTIYQTLDPADNKPHAVAWYKVDPMGRIYCVYDEAIDGNLNQLAERIRQIETDRHFNVDTRIIDPNKGRTPTSVTRCTWQDELADRGLYMEVDVNDDIALGHQKVRGLLAYDKNKPIDDKNQPKLYFTRYGAKNTIFGIRNYIYDEHVNKDKHDGRKDKPRDKYKDFPDCLRYLCVYGAEYYEPNPQPVNLFPATDFSTSR